MSGRWKPARQLPPEPTVRVTCDLDGDVIIPYSAVTIRVCYEDYPTEYRYKCPLCGRVQVRLIHPSTLRSFLSLPMKQEWWHQPDELNERHDHPPITHDDWLDFRRELESL